MGHGKYLQEHPGASSNFDFQTQGASRPLGARAYRCSRGNCGDDIGHPVNQDSHNTDKHAKIQRVYNSSKERNPVVPRGRTGYSF